MGDGPPGGRLRILLGVVLVLVAALAAWMLLDAWRLDPAPAGPSDGPGAGPSVGPGDGGGTGEGPSLSCEAVETGLAIVFGLLALGTLAAGVAAWLLRRSRPDASRVWTIVAAVALAPTLLLGGFWYLVHRLCAGRPPELPQYDCSQLLWAFGPAAVVMTLLAVVTLVLALRRRRGPWAVIAIVAFALAALAAMMWLRTYLACHPPDAPDPVDVDLPCSLAVHCGQRIEFLVCIAVVLLASGAAMTLLGVWRAVRSSRPWWRSGWSVAGMIVLAVGAGVLLLWWLWIPACPSPAGGGGGGGGAGGEGDGTRPVPEVPRLVLVAIVALLALVALAAAVLMRRRGDGGDGAEGPDDVQTTELSAGERAALAAILDRPTHSGEAVIAAYRAFLDWCGRNRMAKRPDEAPGEHAARVVSTARLEPKTAGRLVDLYGLARLTAWEPTAAERDEAVEAARRLMR